MFNNTFIDDNQYSNLVPFAPIVGGVALIKSKKDRKRKDAQQKIMLAEMEKVKAEKRMAFAKTFEERKKAEQDKSSAEDKIDEGKKEMAQATDEANKVENVGGGSKTKKYLIIGGVLVLVIGIGIYLKFRNK